MCAFGSVRRGENAYVGTCRMFAFRLLYSFFHRRCWAWGAACGTYKNIYPSITIHGTRARARATRGAAPSARAPCGSVAAKLEWRPRVDVTHAVEVASLKRLGARTKFIKRCAQ